MIKSRTVEPFRGACASAPKVHEACGAGRRSTCKDEQKETKKKEFLLGFYLIRKILIRIGHIAFKLNEKEHPFMDSDSSHPDPSKRLYFFEIDLVIYFPTSGNDDGRSTSKYGVRYRDFKNKRGQSGVAINLEDVFALADIKTRYPHTICYFEAVAKMKSKYPPKKCLNRRRIQNENDLYNWINELGL